MKKRSTVAFTAMAYVFFAVSVALTLGGIIWYLDQAFSVKGYYGMGMFCTIMVSFTLQKVIRDNEEGKQDIGHRKNRNTGAFCITVNRLDTKNRENHAVSQYVRSFVRIGWV